MRGDAGGTGGGQQPTMGLGGPGMGGRGVSLTREVEEGVENVEALHVVPLDELVGVIVEDFGPGEGAWSCTPYRGFPPGLSPPGGPRLTP